MQTYGRFPLALVRGEGCWVWDEEGKKYLDFISGLGVNSLGHCHPAVVGAVKEQVEKILHCSNLYYTKPQAELAEILIKNSCFDRVFFCNSGAEANEAAIKLARKYSHLKYGEDRKEIISTLNSFHGRTMATITATGQTKYQAGFNPLLPGFKYVAYGDFEALKEAVSSQTCAVLIEPVQGEGGINTAEKDYWQALREFCSQNDILLIFDEVQCGLARTGKLFAYEALGVEPDIITLAKALGGGLPIGAMMARESAASAFRPGDHASTFGGNPVAAAAAVAVMKTFLTENIPGRAEKLGNYFQAKLRDLQFKYPQIKEVRGLGLMIGVEVAEKGPEIVKSCLEKGLLINCTAEKVLRFLPPLIIGEAEVDQAVNILADAFGENFKN
ncbi:MAG TPA: acetylornithine transaminase [Clostridia bacterium]|nr:acetylornithine transaminase [Clostridia bacterium]